jgi:hypothetical protein
MGRNLRTWPLAVVLSTLALCQSIGRLTGKVCFPMESRSSGLS